MRCSRSSGTGWIASIWTEDKIKFSCEPTSRQARFFPITNSDPKDRGNEPGIVLSEGPPAGGGPGALHREMEVGYCRLVTISTDNLIATNEFRTGVDAHASGDSFYARPSLKPDFSPGRSSDLP